MSGRTRRLLNRAAQDHGTEIGHSNRPRNVNDNDGDSRDAHSSPWPPITNPYTRGEAQILSEHMDDIVQDVQDRLNPHDHGGGWLALAELFLRLANHAEDAHEIGKFGEVLARDWTWVSAVAEIFYNYPSQAMRTMNSTPHSRDWAAMMCLANAESVLQLRQEIDEDDWDKISVIGQTLWGGIWQDATEWVVALDEDED